jgi:hypothetical protein
MGTDILQPSSFPLVTQLVSQYRVCGLMSGSRFSL